jgi:hypothetical protein
VSEVVSQPAQKMHLHLVHAYYHTKQQVTSTFDSLCNYQAIVCSCTHRVGWCTPKHRAEHASTEGSNHNYNYNYNLKFRTLYNDQLASWRRGDRNMVAPNTAHGSGHRAARGQTEYLQRLSDGLAQQTQTNASHTANKSAKLLLRYSTKYLKQDKSQTLHNSPSLECQHCTRERRCRRPRQVKVHLMHPRSGRFQ